MSFIKYQHVERFGTQEVEGIEYGECYVFPKLDGTNGCVWLEDGEVQFGSRRRHLVGDFDNAGFKSDLVKDERIDLFFAKRPELRLYGEWLVPHSLKTYRETAWRRFYVFDVAHADEDGRLRYIPYDNYKDILEECCIDYIAPISIIKNGTYERFVEQTKKNNLLIEDGKGIGEGVVIKNYNFKNKYGRTVWAKIVTSEFKEKHVKEMGASYINEQKMVEEEIASEFVTTALIDKTYEKIKLDADGWTSKMIPRLLYTVYYEVVREDCWSFVKKHKNPTINFKRLQNFCILKTKELRKDLF